MNEHQTHAWTLKRRNTPKRRNLPICYQHTVQRTKINHLAAADGHGKVPLGHSGRREFDPHLSQLGLGVHVGSFKEEGVAASGWQGDASRHE